MAEEEHLRHRQVHPDWVQDGEFSSQAFKPTQKDEGKLSVYDGKQIKADDSFTHYTVVQKLRSGGVVSVSTVEVDGAGLRWLIDGVPFPQHGHIDFSGLSGSQIKAKSVQLKTMALARGWTYRP